MNRSEVLKTLALPWVFLFASLGFLAIYAGIALTSHVLVARVFPALGWGAPLHTRPLGPRQITREVGESILSVAIFGLYGVAIGLGVKHGVFHVDDNASWAQVAGELASLTLWNELHFFVIHRALHTRWLYRHVHRFHHRSVRPTPFSTYAMHPFEALLLGSVLPLAMLTHAFCFPAILGFPVVSLMLNTLGHMNYDLVPHARSWHPLAASRRHRLHHAKVTGNYGFLLPTLDWLFGTKA